MLLASIGTEVFSRRLRRDQTTDVCVDSNNRIMMHKRSKPTYCTQPSLVVGFGRVFSLQKNDSKTRVVLSITNNYIIIIY